jgi:hypothetical protein
MSSVAMRRLTCTPRLPRHFTWLLWLALLALPCAQLGASQHEVSHLRSDAAHTKHAPQADHCVACLAAAAIGHGAAPASALLMPPAAAGDDTPETLPVAAHVAAAAYAYLTRAPPVASNQ